MSAFLWWGLSESAAQSSLDAVLDAGQNTITVTAPTVPSLVLTMPQTANTITVTAPAQSQLVEITLAAGQNTITVSAPAQSQLAEITLAAGQNTVTITSPTAVAAPTVILGAGFPVVTDEFTGPDGTSLSAHNANWTVVGSSAFKLVNNQLSDNYTVGGSTDCWAAWTGRSWNADQYARAVVTSTQSDTHFIGLTVRTSSSLKSYYAVNWDSDSYFFYGYDNGVNMGTFSTGAGFAAGDVIELVAIGTSIRVYKNGVLHASTVDSTHTSGSPGVTSWNQEGTTLDSFQCGEIVSQSLSLSAPTAALVQVLDLAAGQNTVTITAPTVPAVHLTMPQTANTVTVTAGTATLLVGIQPKKNLLLWSQDFSDTTWLTNNNGDATGASTTANDTTAPDGTTTATKLTEDSTSLFHNVMNPNVTFPHDRTYANLSVYVKPNSLSYIYLAMYDYSLGSYQRNFIFQGFRLVGAGELIDAYTGLGVNFYYGDRSTAGAHTATIEALPNGWYRVAAGGFLEKPSAGFMLEIGLGKPPVGVPGSMDAEQYFDWNGDNTSNLWIWGAQVESFTNKSQYIKTTSATVANDVLTFGGVTTTVTAPTAVLDQSLLSAGQNTITVTAPTVAAVHLSVPVTVNTITVTAPDATIIADAGALAAGQNTITISAPTVPSLALTMPQTANTITVSAPEETLLAETALPAGQNTITLSAPEETTLAEIALAAGQNTITLSAPEETLSAAITLAAGQNTVILSAPVVPSLALTMPQTNNTVTITAPSAEVIQAGNLFAEANVITVSAPTIPAVHLTIPQTVSTVTLSAPEETILAEITLTAGQNTVTVSAPTADMRVDPFITATANTVTVSAPTAVLLSLDQFIEATVNSVTVSAPLLAGVHLSHVLETNVVTVTAPAPAVTVTFDSIMTPGTAIILVRAPILTVQPQYGGDTIFRETAKLRFTQHETMKV